jgi:hypothetical protein
MVGSTFVTLPAYTCPSRDLAHLPDGVSAQAAVYTDHFAHVSVMRKVLLPHPVKGQDRGSPPGQSSHKPLPDQAWRLNPVMRRSPGNCRREWLAVPAQAAVYTDHFAHVSVMRKVLLRMTSWLHYLYLDH